MGEERRDFGAVEHGAESSVGDKDDDTVEGDKLMIWNATWGRCANLRSND